MTLVVALLCLIVLLVAGRAYGRRSTLKAADVSALVRQARKYRWIKIDEAKADCGGAARTKRITRLLRGREEAIICHKTLSITLLRTHGSPNFKEFDSAEKWIGANPINGDPINIERLYLRAIDWFITKQGRHFDYVQATASDEDLFRAVYAVHQAGYSIGENAEVIGALTLDALTTYKFDRQQALRLLRGLKKDLRARPKVRD